MNPKEPLGITNKPYHKTEARRHHILHTHTHTCHHPMHIIHVRAPSPHVHLTHTHSIHITQTQKVRWTAEHSHRAVVKLCTTAVSEW